MTENRADPTRRHVWLRWLPLVLLVSVSVAAVVSGAYSYLSLDRLLESRASLAAAVEADRATAMATAWLVYVACVVASIPASVFLTMICGFLFGIGAGAMVAVAAATTGAVIVFSIGRWAAADLLLRRAGPRLSGLAEGFRRDAFGYVVILRLLPIFPFWVTNIAPALFGVRLRTFSLATLVGLIPGAFAYAATGSAIETVVASHEAAKAACIEAAAEGCENALALSAFVTPGTMIALVALAAFALISIGLRHRLARRQRQREV